MKRIMIVDDHAPVIRVLKMGLENAGYRVHTARDGLDGLERLRQYTPDFLVTDIDMPRMTGKELCLAITEEFPDREYPIIVLTSRTELEHRDWTRGIDNLSFMEKPVSIRRLLSTIRRSIGETTASVST